jgi:chitin disaccharide deacetylase
MRWLIVTADDFGITSGMNRGIIQAHREGILTSTSLMVDRPACEEAAALGREWTTLSVGIHLELDPNDAGRVPAELERQSTRFTQPVGSAPTHADSHHDVHYDARVLPHVLAWCGRIGVPVRGHSRARHFSKFYGQWGGETHLEQIGVESLLRMFDTEVREGVTELNCHPGYVEPGFPSSYAAEREEELRTLCDTQVHHAILEKGIRLIGFRELSSLATAVPTTDPRVGAPGVGDRGIGAPGVGKAAR